MTVEHKAVPVASFKVLDDDQGIVSTLVSVTGVVDDVKDNINPGAYAKTLLSRTPKGVWSHDWDTPVSKTLAAVELMPGDSRLPEKQRNGEDWPKEAGGLLIETQFNLSTQRGSEAFADVKFFADEQEWSIGYAVPLGGAKVNPKTGVRDIKEIELFEYSPVLFGAMPLTATMGVKDAQAAYAAAKETGFDWQKAASFMEALEAKRAEPEAKAAADDPTMHDFQDDNGDGKCDVCGEADSAHTAEKDAEPVADSAEPEKAVPALLVVSGGTEEEKSWEVVEAATSETVKAFPTEEEAASLVKDLETWATAVAEADLLEAQKASTAALDRLVEGQAKLEDVLAAFDVEDEVKAKLTAALLEKLVTEPVEAKAYLDLPGSYEERQTALWRYASAFTPPDVTPGDPAEEWFDGEGEYDWDYDPYWGGSRCWSQWTSIEATFDDRVIFAHYDYRADADEPATRFYQVAYSWDAGAGTATITASPVEVTVSATVAAKSAKRAERMRKEQKVGRVLSSGNADAVTGAVSALVDVLDAAGISHTFGAAAEGGEAEKGSEEQEEPVAAPLEDGKVLLTAMEVMRGRRLLMDADVAS